MVDSFCSHTFFLSFFPSLKPGSAVERGTKIPFIVSKARKRIQSQRV